MTNEEFIKSISLEGEVWKDIKNFEGFYQISTFGRIVSLSRGVFNRFKDVVKEPRLLRPKMNGTLRVQLSKDSKNYSLHIAKTVLETFLPFTPTDYTVIEYKDGNKTNCSLSNLFYRKPSTRKSSFDTRTISNEVWKPIVGYEDLYEISSLGRVKSKERVVRATNRTMIYQEKILKPFAIGTGYLAITLVTDTKKKFLVHRLVAQAFLDNPNRFTDIDHINTIKTDNRVENLRWVSRSINMNNPLTVRKLSVATRNNPNLSKCTPIVCLLDGELVKEYSSIAEASRDGFLYSSILKCLCGKAKHHKQYEWKYLSNYKNLVNMSKNEESTNEAN